MLLREWMGTPEGRKLWDKLFGSSQKKKEEKGYVSPLRRNQLIKKPIDNSILPVSTATLDNLVDNINFIEQTSTEVTENSQVTTISDLKSVELVDIANYFKGKGVVGEEALVVGIYLALSNNISFGVEGYSGSGKTFLVDKLINLVNEKDLYRAELSSRMAMFYDQDRVNDSNLIYIPELQKALREKNSPVTEIVKNITEGKDARRVVTGKNLQGSEEFIIDKDKTIVYTLALENTFKKDNEASRRFMRFITDSSKEHFEEIHNYKANARMNILLNKNSEDLANRLSKHLNTLRNLSVQVIDPFAEYLQAFIPKTQKSVGYVDHYYNLVDACTRFHFQNREHFTIDGQDYLLAHVEDHYQIHSIYYNEFMKTLEDLAQENEVKQHMKSPNWKKCFIQGRDNLYQSETIQDVLKDNPALLHNWEIRHIGQGQIRIKDYKTGELFVLIDNIEMNKK